MASQDDSVARLREAAKLLLDVAERMKEGRAQRDELDEVVAEIVGAQRETFGRRPRARPGEGAKSKILAHLQRRVGEAVYGEELAAVSGIQEWARRVRELRVEDGYAIAELGNSTYVLEEAEPDDAAAARWGVLNEIRQRPGGARLRVGQLFEAFVGEVVTNKDIDYVSRIAEGVRRQRELRDEFGWPIASHIDDPSLRSGEYRLVSSDPADRRDPSQRNYPEALREEIFARDNYTCQVCGRNRSRAHAAGDTRFYLEVHHRIAIADELAALPKSERNDPANLVTLCHSDHLLETAKLQKKKLRERRSR
ncbi:MAG TPA: HNH endonuclease signature motif containing protein [Phycisphaerales bacterium]|nr:HNH endonuclease signature motif containing protein [Phycisphaerales bacterium]